MAAEKEQPSNASANEAPKATIKSTDMPEELQQFAVDTCIEALDKEAVEKDIASHIKKAFDTKQGATWHCVVGKNFGSYVTHVRPPLEAEDPEHWLIPFAGDKNIHVCLHWHYRGRELLSSGDSAAAYSSNHFAAHFQVWVIIEQCKDSRQQATLLMLSVLS